MLKTLFTLMWLKLRYKSADSSTWDINSCFLCAKRKQRMWALVGAAAGHSLFRVKDFSCVILSTLPPWRSLGNTSWRLRKITRSFWKQLVHKFYSWHTCHKRMDVIYFSSVTGLLSAKTDHKVITEVVQNGNDFTWTQTIPNWTWSNTFSVGQECELVTMKGIKFKVGGWEQQSWCLKVFVLFLSWNQGLTDVFLIPRLQFLWKTEESQSSSLSTISQQRSMGTSW